MFIPFIPSVFSSFRVYFYIVEIMYVLMIFFSQEKSLVWRSQMFLVWQTFYSNGLLSS